MTRPSPDTFRSRVLAVVEASPTPLKAVEIAHRAGLDYLQAVFALNALLNMGKVERLGRKLTARWVRIERAAAGSGDGAGALAAAMRGWGAGGGG